MATKKASQILTPTTSPTATATGLAVVPQKPESQKPESQKIEPNKTAVKKTALPQAAPPKVTPTKKAVAVTPSPKATLKRKTKLAANPELVLSLELLQDEIRREAYDYFIQRSYRPGDPKADWLRSEDAVLRRHGLR